MIVGGGTGREETVSIRNNFFFNAILGVVALCLSGCRPGVLLLDSLRRIVAGIARRQYQPTFNFRLFFFCNLGSLLVLFCFWYFLSHQLYETFEARASPGSRSPMGGNCRFVGYIL